MRKKLSLMLALLLIAATGAWAAAVAGETITLKCGSTVKTYENVTLPWSTTAEILKQVITDMNFMPPSIGTITKGDGKVVKNGNENFQVTGTFSGEATVAVTYYNSSMTSSTATITVTAPGAAGTSGSGDVKMAEGTEDAENWTLSDGTNTAKGNVGLTGVPEKTKVTATYGGTKKVKSVKAVKKKVLVTSITLNQTGNITRFYGDSGTLSVTSVLPEDATDKTYTWSSSDPYAVSIDQNGNWRVVGRSGNANLRATANDGSGVYAQITVWVRN